MTDEKNAYQYFQFAFEIYFYCAIIIQNITVLVLSWRKSKYVVLTRPLFTNSIIVADCVTSLLLLTDASLRSLEGRKLIAFRNYLQASSKITICSKGVILVSQWCQLAFVLDRLVNIRFPQLYKARFTKVRRWVVCAAIWVTCIIATGIYAKVSVSASAKFQSFIASHLFYLIFICIPGPLSLLLFIYIQILVCQARARTRRLRGLPDSTWATRVLEGQTGLILSATVSIITSFGFPLYYALEFTNSMFMKQLMRQMKYRYKSKYIVANNVTLDYARNITDHAKAGNITLEHAMNITEHAIAENRTLEHALNATKHPIADNLDKLNLDHARARNIDLILARHITYVVGTVSLLIAPLIFAYHRRRLKENIFCPTKKKQQTEKASASKFLEVSTK